MTETEKAIRDFCGHHADWWPSTTQVQEMLALAQPKQEPVAWMFQHNETGRMSYVSNDGLHNPTMFVEMNPRYALACPLYTTPPQRKPLTDEEIDIAWRSVDHTIPYAQFRIDVAKAIEAKLKEQK